MSSHLLFQATNGMDIGAVSMMLYGWREREEVLRYLEYVTGLRMNHNFIRPGGVAADLPDGWQERAARALRHGRARHRRVRRVAVGEPDLARADGRDRPDLPPKSAWRAASPDRSCARPGFAWDLRKAQPYLAYDEVDFDVVYGANGDVFDRYRLRLSEIYESMKIVRQCVERMPAGDYRTQDKKLTPPPRARIDESMEALIHHFKLFTEGLQGAGGGDVRCDRVAAGEIGCYMVSDGSGKPVRMHIRGPSFYNLQSIEPMGTRHSWPTRWPSCRASTRSWARSTDDVLHRSEPPRPRRSSRGTRGRSRRSSRSRTWPRTRTSGVARGGRARSRSSPASPPPRCRAPRPSTRCSSAVRADG